MHAVPLKGSRSPLACAVPFPVVAVESHLQRSRMQMRVMADHALPICQAPAKRSATRLMYCDYDHARNWWLCHSLLSVKIVQLSRCCWVGVYEYGRYLLAQVHVLHVCTASCAPKYALGEARSLSQCCLRLFVLFLIQEASVE
eukprot:3832693-Pleurochrysis_carterae.AAC.1